MCIRDSSPTTPTPLEKQTSMFAKMCLLGGGGVANVFRFIIDVNHDYILVLTLHTWMMHHFNEANQRIWEDMKSIEWWTWDIVKSPHSCIYRIGQKNQLLFISICTSCRFLPNPRMRGQRLVYQIQNDFSVYYFSGFLESLTQHHVENLMEERLHN